jgi:hypothetical protein
VNKKVKNGSTKVAWYTTESIFSVQTEAKKAVKSTIRSTSKANIEKFIQNKTNKNQKLF